MLNTCMLDHIHVDGKGVLFFGGPFVAETTPIFFFVNLFCRSLLLGSFEIHVCSTKYMWGARIVVFEGFVYKRTMPIVFLLSSFVELFDGLS